MSAPAHHGRLTSTDASFLYFERPSAPMHIGAVAILEGELDFERYRGQVAAKLRRLPRFREKVVSAPLHLGHPTWETDPEFDLDRHIVHHQLQKPTERELHALVDVLIAGVMPRDRPLWELHIVHGLPGGNTGLVSKVHHAMVDGVGGNAILTTILDLERSPPRVDEDDDYEPSAPPSTGRRVADALFESMRRQIDLWSEQMKALTERGQHFDAERLQTTVAVLGETLPDLALPPRRLPFNRPCNGERRFVWTRLNFAEARAIRGALGGTVNDVMLTALGGAVGRYLEQRGESAEDRTMRVMVPVNVRSADAGAALGNQVSALPVKVPLGIKEPMQRMRAVRGVTRMLKDGRIAEGVSTMVNLSGAVPAMVQAAVGAVAINPFPVFNLVCTNVPGPQIPLYADGHRLLEYYPHVPVGHDMGVCCAIFSYNQTLFIGLNSDVGACPDVDLLRDSLDEAFAEMKAAAGIGDLGTIEIGRAPGGEGSNGGASAARPSQSAKAAVKRRRAKAAAKRTTKKKTASKRTTAKKKAKKKTARKKRAAKKTRKKTTARKKPAAKKTRKKKAAAAKTRSGRSKKRRA